MKKLFCLIFCFECFATIYAQSNTPSAKTAIGKTYKRIDEIVEFKNFKEGEGVFIADLKETNTFIAIPIKGIDCFNDEFENQE
jgi:hypothetical protein